MTITFPRYLLDGLPIAGLSFFPEPMIEVTPLRSGIQISADLGPTLWRGKWELSILDNADAGAVRAVYDTLLSLEVFYGYDKLREYPLAYPNGFTGLTVGGNPFTGICTLDAVADNNKEIDLIDLPADFIFTVGDYIAFDYGAGDASRALHRVSAGATANANGEVTVEVRPHIRVGWEVVPPAVRTVSLYRPSAKMVIVPGTYADQASPPALVKISFEAIQTL